jgi:hypothetical protein
MENLTSARGADLTEPLSQAELDFAWVEERARLVAELPPVEERVAVRERIGVTAKDLALIIGSARTFIFKFERGETVPKGRHLDALVKFYRAAKSGGEAL